MTGGRAATRTKKAGGPRRWPLRRWPLRRWPGAAVQQRRRGADVFRETRGLSALEFALVLPLLLMLALGTIEGTKLVFTANTLSFAVQRGGRLAALASTPDVATVQASVVSHAPGLNLSTSDVTVTVNGGATAYSARQPEQVITVTATYRYTYTVPFAFAGNTGLTLQKQSVTAVESVS